jgi:hypothetical protein
MVQSQTLAHIGGRILCDRTAMQFGVSQSKYGHGTVLTTQIDVEAKMWLESFQTVASDNPPWGGSGIIIVLGALLIMAVVGFLWSKSVNRRTGHTATDGSSPRFLHVDAWFLAALGLCDRGRVPLTWVIAMGDVIQHAILTREEVNGALGRLGRAGYVIRHSDGTLELTEAGRSVVEKAGQGRGVSPYEAYERVVRLLGASPWTPAYDPHRAGDKEAAQVSEAEYDEAIRSHQSRSRSRDVR